MTEPSFFLIVVATILQFVLGALWYSPLLFGKWWMQIMECDSLSKDELKSMQKKMMPFYFVQLALTFFTTFSLSNFMYYGSRLGFYHTAFWIWIGFMAPVSVASVIWANTKQKFWAKQILIMLTNQLAGIMLTAYILSM